MNAIVRFCYWCQSISDRLSERRKRISQFRSEYERLAIPGPQLSQKDIDAAAAQGAKALWHRLTLEKEKAMSICLQAEEKVGPVPKYEHWLGIDRIVKGYGLRVANVFHAGDGNLHPLILFDANQPGELERAETFGAEILELSVALGGTITGEHGVGVEKINQMCAQFASAELRQFFRIKAAFDPPGLLNPGKAIPTLNRCAEYGRMRISGGELAHPELPRF